MDAVTVVDIQKAKITDPKEIESKGNQLFNVPNTPEGLAFLKQAQRYLNRAHYIRLRKKGRGPNRPKNRSSHDLKISDSAWLAVYADQTSDFWKKHYAEIERHCEWARKEVRKQIAQEQLKGGGLLPETIALMREQVARELMPVRRQEIIDACKVAVNAALDNLRRG